LLGLSLFLVSKGRPASAPPSADIRVDPARVMAAPPPSSIPAAPAAPVVATHLPDQTPQTDLPDVSAPAALRRLVAVRTARLGPVAPDIECMAKVVYHEAANQALQAQLAVAQVVLNRTVGGPDFPKDVCAVVSQPGQFFQPASYAVPASDQKRWKIALAIAALARTEHLAQMAPGALFFHAVSVRPAWSSRRERVAQIGDQIFYR